MKQTGVILLGVLLLLIGVCLGGPSEKIQKLEEEYEAVMERWGSLSQEEKSFVSAVGRYLHAKKLDASSSSSSSSSASTSLTPKLQRKDEDGIYVSVSLENEDKFSLRQLAM